MGNGRREEKKALLDGARSLSVELGQRELGLLLGYAELVREWNQRINLVSRRDIGNLVTGHIVDSLAGVPVLNKLMSLDHGGKAVSLGRQAGGQPRDDTAPTHPPLSAGIPARKSTSNPHPPKVMDLGSGGGLPGIPLKICLPYIDLTLVESTKKKARFLDSAVNELGLEGVTVIDRHSRELEREPEYIGGYYIVTARAVAGLKELVALAFPFLKAGGWLVAYKGAKAEYEIADASPMVKKTNGAIEVDLLRSMPGSGKERHIVVVRKQGSLDER